VRSLSEELGIKYKSKYCIVVAFKIHDRLPHSSEWKGDNRGTKLRPWFETVLFISDINIIICAYQWSEWCNG
jgi:hypothetical protein